MVRIRAISCGLHRHREGPGTGNRVVSTLLTHTDQLMENERSTKDDSNVHMHQGHCSSVLKHFLLKGRAAVFWAIFHGTKGTVQENEREGLYHVDGVERRSPYGTLTGLIFDKWAAGSRPLRKIYRCSVESLLSFCPGSARPPPYRSTVSLLVA
jgi:hypothetical protein